MSDLIPFEFQSGTQATLCLNRPLTRPCQQTAAEQKPCQGNRTGAKAINSGTLAFHLEGETPSPRARTLAPHSLVAEAHVQSRASEPLVAALWVNSPLPSTPLSLLPCPAASLNPGLCSYSQCQLLGFLARCANMAWSLVHKRHLALITCSMESGSCPTPLTCSVPCKTS